MVLLPQVSPRILLKHRALRAPIEELAQRFDHPFLATEARYYESIQLNKKLGAASIWRSQSRSVMWVCIGGSYESRILTRYTAILGSMLGSGHHCSLPPVYYFVSSIHHMYSTTY